MGIKIIDSVIIGEERHWSLKETINFTDEEF